MTVDKTEQRRRIAEVTANVIAAEGVDAATIRRIAAELGYSTSIVTYYFADKQELLMSAYESLRDDLYERFGKVLRSDPQDLVGALLCMTAVDAVSIRRWKNYVALWQFASRDPHWSACERDDVEFAIASIERVVAARNPKERDPQQIARMLNLFIQGVSVQALIDPDSLDSSRLQRDDRGLGRSPPGSARTNAGMIHGHPCRRRQGCHLWIAAVRQAHCCAADEELK